MLLITTLVAVIMSVGVMVPGIGIALAMASVPALLRTYVLVRRRREAGMPVTNQDKAVLFVLCLGIAVLIAIATGAAFFVPCFVSAFAGAATNSNGGLMLGSMIGIIAGLIASLTVLIYLLRKWLRNPTNKPTTGELPNALREYFDNPPEDEPNLIETVPPEPRADSPREPPLAQASDPPTKPPGDATP